MVGILAFIIPGTGLIVYNGQFIKLNKYAKVIDQNLKSLNPEIFLNCINITIKIDGLYFICSNKNYFRILKMIEKNQISVTWIRNVLGGPKMPKTIPLHCPVIGEINDLKIRRCEGKAKVYEIAEDQWISGEAVMFSIMSTDTMRLHAIFYPSTLRSLINLIKES